MSRIQGYGAGRVFICALGRGAEVRPDPRILRRYLGGIRFAIGDLSCDTMPGAKLPR